MCKLSHHDVRLRSRCHPPLARAREEHESTNGNHGALECPYRQHATSLRGVEDPGRGASVAGEEEAQCTQVVRPQNSDGGTTPFPTPGVENEAAHDRSSVDALGESRECIPDALCVSDVYKNVPTKGTHVDAYPGPPSLPHPSATAPHVCNRDRAVHSHGAADGAAHDDAYARRENLLLVHLDARRDDAPLSHEWRNVFGCGQQRPGGRGGASVLNRTVADRQERQEE